MALLHGPYPAGFQVWIHHCDAPCTGVTGKAAQFPVPLGQPTWAAVYHCWILFPVESSTHR